MIALVGGDVVLADRVVAGATVLVDGDRIAAVTERGTTGVPAGVEVIDARGGYVVPGFIDVHVHGVDGYDTLDDEASVAAIAGALPRFGVTAFCPTSVACAPAVLDRFLRAVQMARAGAPRGARVLPAHLESNFINPEYAGAQPIECLRLPPAARPSAASRLEERGQFLAEDVLAVVRRHLPQVGIVTMAPELPGAFDLIRELVAAGLRVSIGHTGADYDTTVAAIAAGARQATHLFNRMGPMSHRALGAAGAVLESPDVTVELIADGVHVHPGMCRVVIATKGVARVMAITDATAGAGLPVGSAARLGGRGIHVDADAVRLDDGTLAGSTATMDRIFATLVKRCGASVVDAAAMCALTPARQLGLADFGQIAPGAMADLVVLGPDCDVRRVMVGGLVLV